MKPRSARSTRGTALALLFSLAGLFCILALPGRHDGPDAPAPASGSIAPIGLTATRTDGSANARLPRSGEIRLRDPSALARILEHLLGEIVPEAARLAVLERLGGSATAAELVRLVSLATPHEGEPSDAVRAAFRAAFEHTLERDARAHGELVPAWRRAGSALRTEILAAVGQRGDPAGLEFLAWVATFERGEHERALAEACLRLAPRARGPAARASLERLCELLDSEDGACVQTVSSALASARVEAAIPTWIELLTSDSRGTRERARRSLETLTGLELGPKRARWLAWLASELAWFEEEAPGLFAELECADDARVLAALRAISTRRLHREQLAEAVEPLLEHAVPAVRVHACSALEALHSSLSLPALVAALADEDETVARRAWSALRSLTGLDLPLDEELWLEELEGPY